MSTQDSFRTHKCICNTRVTNICDLRVTSAHFAKLVPGSQSPLQFISKALDEVEVGALRRPVIPRQTGETISFYLALCQGVLTYFWPYNVPPFYLVDTLSPAVLLSCLFSALFFRHPACSHLLHMKHKAASLSLSLALTLFLPPAALMDANGGVCGGKELTFMPLIRTCSPNAL